MENNTKKTAIGGNFGLTPPALRPSIPWIHGNFQTIKLRNISNMNRICYFVCYRTPSLVEKLITRIRRQRRQCWGPDQTTSLSCDRKLACALIQPRVEFDRLWTCAKFHQTRWKSSLHGEGAVWEPMRVADEMVLYFPRNIFGTYNSRSILRPSNARVLMRCIGLPRSFLGDEKD